MSVGVQPGILLDVDLIQWRDAITIASDAVVSAQMPSNDNLMDKLIYTDQSTCAISRLQRAAVASNQLNWPPLAIDHNSLGTLYFGGMQVTKTANYQCAKVHFLVLLVQFAPIFVPLQDDRSICLFLT